MKQAIVTIIFVLNTLTYASANCSALRDANQEPDDLALCSSLESVVRKPANLDLKSYEEALAKYLSHFCHRNAAAGWKSDKHIRDTGPYVAVNNDGAWGGKSFGTHTAVVVWYSPEMLAWLHRHRADAQNEQSASHVPDGAVIVKEMFPAPAASCADVDVLKLFPANGAAIMVRDEKSSQDGWFWGWYGWNDWQPDWPADASNGYPNMGFGLYCVNCHASAKDNQTFSSLHNIKGEPGSPLVYLSQTLIENSGTTPQHQAVTQATVPELPLERPGASRAFMTALGLPGISPPPIQDIADMPSVVYDTVFSKPQHKSPAGFVTSDQCLGCHDAGGTGLQFDMTRQGEGGKLINLSPYGTWRSSPMGLSGRDPVFFAQLASETDTFHKEAGPLVQDTCLGCHGILGQRAFKADTGGACEPLTRKSLDINPATDDRELIAKLAAYAGLARDGVSCVACHRMAFGSQADEAMRQPQNACLHDRRELLTPGLTGIAATFTGSYVLGAPDRLIGQFDHPKQQPMLNALDASPVHNSAVASSELCGTCHTIHLPIFANGKIIGRTYEQTTYAEWAFSDYRTGATPVGSLPTGPGSKAQSCQNCHMPAHDSDGKPTRSKIASIQEYSNFPQTDFSLPAKDIDLPVREGFARHTLVGLNVFFVRMAKQFSKTLGLRLDDPMLGSKAVDPFSLTEHEMTDQAATRTASVSITKSEIKDDHLNVTVVVANKAGHKFPSGVGFRRAFLEFIVRDGEGKIVWASGRTNGAGVIVDGSGQPLASELWWNADCSERLASQAKLFQPHYEVIRQQNEAQIYEDLAAEPADGDTASCQADTPATGPLTTSFLSRCIRVKDNRILPEGFLNLNERKKIASALGAQEDLADEVAPRAVGDDKDYLAGGSDSIRYSVAMRELPAGAKTVEANLYYQATPPYYLQDRFCTSQSADTSRLKSLTANLNLDDIAKDWKLKITGTGLVDLP